MENIQTGIIEDNASIRDNLTAYIKLQPGLEVAFAAPSMEAGLAKLRLQEEVDVLLLDIGLPGTSGLEGIRPVLKLRPSLNVVMLTTYEEEDTIFKALCAGASGYLSKRTSLEKIVEAVRVIHRGGSYMSPSIARKVINHFRPAPTKTIKLTPRQLQIAQGITEGLSYKLIADKYMISVETVRDHIKKIYRTLNINSKSELVRKSLLGEIS